MLKKLIDGYCQLLGYVIAAALALMVVLVFGNVFMRYAFKGTYEQFMVNKDSESPVMEVSMGWFYAGGMAFSILSLPILLLDLYRLLTGQIDDDHLMLMQESEEAPHGTDDTKPAH
jgi:TRAP-type C4-dicarboxylate transport system permease small subunit